MDTHEFDLDNDEVEIVGIEAFEDVPEGHRSGFVTIVGRPNVGKSTLLNAFLQQKIAIATPRPQTTRVRQLGIITESDYQMIFVDTPGIMEEPRHKLDEFMLDTAVSSLRDADVVLWLVEASELVGPGDRAIAEKLAQLGEDTAVVLGINKLDLLEAAQVQERAEAYQSLLPNAPWVMFSATTGHGRDELMQLLIEALPEGPRLYPADQVTDAYLRDIAAELIREQLLLQLREEIPYGTAVKIDEFKERDKGVTYIGATIYVERENHKAIVIGHKGSQLRDLGTAARQEIEKLLEQKVFLELWVKAEPKWRRNERALQRLGYSSN
ncbi:MAG: GTPase Era [Chloroflexota bacterium]